MDTAQADSRVSIAPDIGLAKAAHRTPLLRRLAATDPDVAAVAAPLVCAQLRRLSVLEDVELIAVYAALPFEICLRAFVDEARGRGVQFCYPRSQGRHYEMVVVANPEVDLQPGVLGILEPRQALPALAKVRRRSLAWLVPGVAFDEHGNRLGRGAGHYDRLLRGAAGVKIGIGYDWQLVPRLPAASHDVPMDLVVTDQRVCCSRANDTQGDA